jgi:2,3-bisphosphoglycerate-independent phosphoglycerate mutase
VKKIPNTPLLLIILDGFGFNVNYDGNAIELADMTNYKSLLKNYPNTLLVASGEAVGLPEGIIGNSEVGHMTIGAGRIPWQDITRIDKAIQDGSFFEHPYLLRILQKVKNTPSKVHLIGLVSDGGVHSMDRHYLALLKFFANNKVEKEKVVFHCITDGRDTEPKIAKKYLNALLATMKDYNCGVVFCVSGRYYAMDRDKRWDRTKLFYEAITEGKGLFSSDALSAVEEAYLRGETDEFIKPTIVVSPSEISKFTISSGDCVICFNFRADRVRQITLALTEAKFNGFERNIFPVVDYLCFTEYFKENNKLPALFSPLSYTNVLSEVLSNAGIRHFKIAETEKYAHITYFLNVGKEEPFELEERVLIPSPKVATYDLAPLMSAPLITSKLLEVINSDSFPMYIVNFANPDMVGHTGKLEPTIQALKYLDSAITSLVKSILSKDGTVILTSDHGNCEQMLIFENGACRPHTAHTLNPVPFVLINNSNFSKIKLKVGKGLSSVAPTILEILKIFPPKEFSAPSLIES